VKSIIKAYNKEDEKNTKENEKHSGHKP
jgi:hypothetical protein